MSDEHVHDDAHGLVRSLPDRPLRLRECDRIRQHDRVSFCASFPDGRDRVRIMGIRVDGVSVVLAHDADHGGWHVVDRFVGMPASEFESIMVGVSRELQFETRERDRVGRERSL